jgi:hypothetical protein
VILVFADGWDTLRSMIVGWSTKVGRSEAIANEESGEEAPRLPCRATASDN